MQHLHLQVAVAVAEAEVETMVAVVEKEAGADHVAVPLATQNVTRNRSHVTPALRTMSTTAASVETSVHPTPAALPHAPGAPAVRCALRDSRTVIPTHIMDVKQMLTTMP